METIQTEDEQMVRVFMVTLPVDGKQQMHTAASYRYHGAFKSVCPTLSAYAYGDTLHGAEYGLRLRVRQLGGSTGPTIRKAVPRACPPPANDYQLDESEFEDDVDDGAPTLRMIQAAEPVEISFDLVSATFKLVDIQCSHCGAVARLATQFDHDTRDLECPSCHVVGGMVAQS